MSISPIEFTKAFERLKSQVADQTVPDLKLLLLADFWTQLEPHSGTAAYQNYFDEYVPLFAHLVSPENLADLTIDELKSLFEVSECLITANSAQIAISRLREVLTVIAGQLARMYFYAGAVEEGLAVLSRLYDTEDVITVKDEDLSGLSEFHALTHVIKIAPSQSAAQVVMLQEILDEWEQDVTYQDRINCLFVEKDSYGRSYRGRMHTLSGHVHLFGKQAVTDEITFDNQIRSPDDPFVGSAYDSLKAIRTVFKRNGLKSQASLRYHAHLSIANASHTFTGDSIGLAVGLLAYTQLLQPEITRQSRCISSQIAITGGVDEDGSITKVNDQTLRKKIERAFFSPAKYVVIPDQNLDYARDYVGTLQRDYPRRNLRLISARLLEDVIENKNVIREEKVCPLEYGAKLVRKYSGTTKLQIPLLLILIYILTCLVYPKAWIGFDYRIDHLKIIGNRFEAINPDGHVIFTSGEFEGPLQPETYSQQLQEKSPRHLAIDIDNDDKDELFFSPALRVASRGHMVYLYDDGEIRDSSAVFVRTTYPGDDSNARYSLSGMHIIRDRLNDPYILTIADCSLPARCQLMLFDTNLDVVSGPYLHTGALITSSMRIHDLDGDGLDEILIGGINNRCERAAFAILNPWNLFGVSPPHDSKLFIESGMQKGSQLLYVTFAETPLSDGENVRNEVIWIGMPEKNGDNWRIDVAEAYNLSRSLDIGNVSVLYYLNHLLIPQESFIEDTGWEKMKSGMRKLHRTFEISKSALLDTLLHEVAVYHGNTLVHHAAKGIINQDKSQ